MAIPGVLFLSIIDELHRSVVHRHPSIYTVYAPWSTESCSHPISPSNPENPIV